LPASRHRNSPADRQCEGAKDVFAKLRNNSITVPGEEVNALSEASRDLKIAIVMGASERIDAGPGHGTLYNSLLSVSEDGQLKNHHRKLVPTYTERLVWGNGDGRGLEAVPTSVGRVGGLICWEHWMRSRAWQCTIPASTSTSPYGQPSMNYIS
jgi:nitrilase